MWNTWFKCGKILQNTEARVGKNSHGSGRVLGVGGGGNLLTHLVQRTPYRAGDHSWSFEFMGV